MPSPQRHKKTVDQVLEAGVVGSLDYKIIEATRADDLFTWLKDNKYSYSGDEATLEPLHPEEMALHRHEDRHDANEAQQGRHLRRRSHADALPVRLRKAGLSAQDYADLRTEKTEALFYVQAPFKVDLPGDFTYQYTWVPMLQAATGCTPGGIKGGGEQWLKEFGPQIPPLLARANQLNFRFVAGQRPQPNNKGHIPTTMEWARKLSKDDVGILAGKAPYSEKVPNVDEGFTRADLKDPQRAEAVY